MITSATPSGELPDVCVLYPRSVASLNICPYNSAASGLKFSMRASIRALVALSAHPSIGPRVLWELPLPAWAVSSLHEIRYHAKNHEDGAISAKVGLIAVRAIP